MMTRPPPPIPSDAFASTPDTNEGRRKHHRLGVRMSAEIRTERAVFTAVTRDLSEGGAGLLTDRAITDGEEIALGLFLVVDDVEEHIPPLWVGARVMWSAESDHGEHPHSAGVRFQVISDEQKQWLRQILKYLEEHRGPSA
jgi:c-di-GMP-binding flagellar brake protein YcgR